MWTCFKLKSNQKQMTLFGKKGTILFTNTRWFYSFSNKKWPTETEIKVWIEYKVKFEFGNSLPSFGCIIENSGWYVFCLLVLLFHTIQSNNSSRMARMIGSGVLLKLKCTTPFITVNGRLAGLPINHHLESGLKMIELEKLL